MEKHIEDRGEENSGASQEEPGEVCAESEESEECMGKRMTAEEKNNALNQKVMEQTGKSLEEISGLSRNERKRLLSSVEYARRMKEKKTQKKERLRQQRQLQQAAIAEKKLNGEPVDWSSLKNYSKGVGKSRSFKAELRQKLECAPVVVIDCDFAEQQGEKEMRSLVTQLSHCVCLNKKASFPLRIRLVGVYPALGEQLAKQ